MFSLHPQNFCLSGVRPSWGFCRNRWLVASQKGRNALLNRNPSPQSSHARSVFFFFFFFFHFPFLPFNTVWFLCPCAIVLAISRQYVVSFHFSIGRVYVIVGGNDLARLYVGNWSFLATRQLSELSYSFSSALASS